MAKYCLKSNLSHLFFRHRHKTSGFTLIELLVTLIVGSLILAGMLYLVVQLLQISRREEVLTRTQQDMKRALDYITRDVREAVYVYPKPTVVLDPAQNPNQTDTLLAQLTGSLPANATPILAFWRFDPVDVQKIPKDNDVLCTAPNPKSAECNSLKVRQGTYSLVLYLQQENAAGDIWGGKSRILRYELSKYKNLATLEQNKGYSDPSGTCNSFRNWSKPPGRNANQPCDSSNAGTPASTIAVLTDYVNTALNQAPCPTGYEQTPVTPASFYACVSSGTTTAANQVVKVFLQGSIDERDNQISPLGFLTKASSLPTLEAEILVRGILDKEPPATTP